MGVWRLRWTKWVSLESVCNQQCCRAKGSRGFLPLAGKWLGRHVVNLQMAFRRLLVFKHCFHLTYRACIAEHRHRHHLRPFAQFRQ